jgi:hypothetical protein
MPYGIPKETKKQTKKMEDCVASVMKQGKDKSSAIAICKASITNREGSISGHLRLLNIREDQDKRIIRVAIVSEEVDSYDTVINPDGLVSPLESVPVDYNHNRVSTGAKIKDAGYEMIEVPDGNGGKKKTKSRVVEVEVYKDSKLRTQQNKDKEDTIPSAYEAVENGRIGWVSIDFEPIKEYIEVVYNSAGEKLREVYNRWRLNFLSLLDTKPGQDTAYIMSVRMKNLNSNLNKINNINMENKNENKRMYPDVLQNKAGELFAVVKEVEEEGNGNETKTYTLKDISGREMQVNKEQINCGMDSGKEKEYSIPSAGQMLMKIFSMIKPQVEERQAKEEKNPAEKQEAGKPEEKKEGKNVPAPKEKDEANNLPKEKTECATPKRDGEKKEDNKEAEMQRMLKEKDEKIAKLNDLYKRVSNSPKVESNTEEDPATDLAGEDADSEDEDTRTAKAVSRSRFVDYK